MRLARVFVLASLFASTVSWAQSSDKLKVSGDFRYRSDNIDDHTFKYKEYSQKIRAKLRVEGAVDAQTKVVIQGATGSGGATTNNQTLGATAAFNKRGYFLDQGYIQYRAGENDQILAGKVKNTLYIPGESELIWDADVTPEGVTYNHLEKSYDGSLFWNVGVYAIKDEGVDAISADSDKNLYVAQLGKTFKQGNIDLLAAIGWNQFTSLKNQTFVGGALGNKTSTTVPGAYATDFEVLDLMGTMKFQQYELYLDLLQNTGASKDNSGYVLGVIYGQLKDKGTWTASYSYRAVQPDATLGYITDSDFGGGGTDVRGHRLNGKYQLAENTVLGGSLFLTEKNVKSNKTTYNRLMLDVSVKF